MRLYKVVFDQYETGSQDGDGEWDVGKVDYVVSPVAREVCKKYEERDDTRFKGIELVSRDVVQIDPQ